VHGTTVNGAAETGLVVPVPAATTAVAPWRERLDPTAVHGVPAHITVLYPFVPPPALTPAVTSRLGALFASARPFDFALRRIGWFGDDVVYLAPDPPEPFVALTRLVADAYPEHPPYEGAYAEITPHLTIGSGPRAELRRAADAVRTSLPIRARAGDVWLMVGTSSPTGRWRVRARYPLGGGPPT
jgi:2'-5' RNA ligase